MPGNPRGTVFPNLACADIVFLCKAIGFEERFRHPMDEGRLGHAEFEGGVLMLASVWEEMGFASPDGLAGTPAGSSRRRRRRLSPSPSAAPLEGEKTCDAFSES